jgi:parvulin-like peptidyl-prolyl isomerase
MLRLKHLVLGCATLLSLSGASARGQSNDTIAEPLFASVNTTLISAAEFDRNAREAFRRKFYHGTPPEAELNNMLKSVGQTLIDNVLIDTEATKRGIAADADAVAKGIAQLDRRNSNNPQWDNERTSLLPGLTEQLEQKSRRELLEKEIRAGTPSQDEVLEFYRSNPALFTEPTQNKISLIMIGVDPSSSPEVWDQAFSKAEGISNRLGNGEDFAQLAKAFSSDRSAADGGDLSYVHQGMLGQQTEIEVAKLQPGVIAKPFRTLEGIAIVRLDARTPERLQPFDAVAPRARDLLSQQQGETRWSDFLVDLRAKAKIVIGPAFEKIMSSPEPEPAGAPR